MNSILEKIHQIHLTITKHLAMCCIVNQMN